MSKRLILGVLLAVVAVFLVACEVEEEVEGPDASPTQATPTATAMEPELSRYRFGNVSIEVPAPKEPDDMHVARGRYTPGIYSPDFSPDGAVSSVPAITLAKGQGPEASWVVIDADTGKVLYERVRREHQTEFDAVLATLRMEGELTFDDPWPYGTMLPATARMRWGNITYLEPHPTSGIVVQPGLGDGPDGAGAFLIVSSAKSSRHIDAMTGRIDGELDRVDDSDREAFSRFMSEIRLVAGESP